MSDRMRPETPGPERHGMRAPLQVLLKALGVLRIADYQRARSSSFSVPSKTDPSVYLEQKPHDENSSVEFPQRIKEIPDHEFGKVLKRLKEGRQGMEFKLTKRFFATHPDKRARYAFIKQMEHAHYLWTTIAEIEKRKINSESNVYEHIETIKSYIIRIGELYLDMGCYYGM